MLCGWEGNCRSDVALVMHHGLNGISTYGLMDKGRKVSTLPTLVRRGLARFT